MKTSVLMTAELRPALMWGHPLLTPDGDEIRVPYSVFGPLRKLGLLSRNHDHHLHLYQLSPMIWEFLEPDYASLIGSVRRILGKNLSGPTTWLECHCLTCKRERSEVLRDLVPNWKDLIDRTKPGLDEF